VVFRILPHEFGAKARTEGPSGNRALQRKADPMADNTAPWAKGPPNDLGFLLRTTMLTPGREVQVE